MRRLSPAAGARGRRGAIRRRVTPFAGRSAIGSSRAHRPAADRARRSPSPDRPATQWPRQHRFDRSRDDRDGCDPLRGATRRRQGKRRRVAHPIVQSRVMPTTTALSARTLADVDPDIARAIANEVERQETGLELIASENFVSAAVLEATGTIFTNKYAEGYPGRRYYGGCEYVDVVESLAISRAKALFGAEHANVQPHSGAQANMAVYFTVMKPGETVLGLNLAHGGHLTHGHPLNFSGLLYKVVAYGVKKDDERIDYDELDRLADQHKPRMIIVGASAYPRVIDFA